MGLNSITYDVIIIGAGPIGLACGIEAKKNEFTHLIIEKGCLVNSIFNYPTNMTFFSTSERLEIGEVPFISHGVKPTRTEALEYYRRVKDHWKLNVNKYEKAVQVFGKKGNISVKTNKAEYKCKHLIVSTGFFDFANSLNVPGEQLDKVKHYYDEPHPYVGQKIVVIGGGNSAVDVALETYRRGSDVTMVVKNAVIDPGVKYWVRPDIENRIKEGAIKSFFNSTVSEIRTNEIDINTPEGKITLENDFVLAMTGYHPDFDFLESIGINYKPDSEKEPVFDNETFETNVKGVYLAGVVCGGMDTRSWFIENSRYHAENVMKHIKQNKSS